MKFRKFKIISGLLIGIFLLSTSNPTLNKVQAQQIEVNFELWFFVEVGIRIYEAYALYFKQALAPLGIDLKIVAMPHGQFVGDLVHQSTGIPFDLTLFRFSDRGPTPGFMWAYHSTSTTFGQTLYRLNDPDWQDWQERDADVSTKDIDSLLEELEFEMDLVKKQSLVDQFAELFMSDLLYDFPLVSSEDVQAVWAGFGGPNNELWVPDEGYIGSRRLGASFNTTLYGGYDSVRAAGGGNDTNWRQSIVNPAKFTFDSMSSSDTASKSISINMRDTLFNIDKDWNVHPGLVWNWFVEDAIGEFDGNLTNGLEVSKSGHHKFFFRDDAWWPETTNYQGEVIPAQKLDADDMLFTLEILLLENIRSFGQEAYLDLKTRNPYFIANVSSTLTTNDTLDIYVKPGFVTTNDFLIYGAKNHPFPRHILGGNLHYIDENGTETIGTARELDAQGLSPQDTEEWKYWATNMNGRSLVGPYDIVEYTPGEVRSYQARSDYYYPNEWDTTRYYGNGSAFLKIETAAENLTIGDLGIFAPHLNDLNPKPYYWAFADDPLTIGVFEKPTTQGIEQYFDIVIEHYNPKLLAFEEGTIDHYKSTSIGVQRVDDHLNDPTKIVKTPTPVVGPDLLIFNLLQDHLKKINVRKAIAYVIDKDQLVKIHDGYATRVDSPVWLSSGSWYKSFPLDYDYGIARDLMRSEGYSALECGLYCPHTTRTTTSDVSSSDLGSLTSTMGTTTTVNIPSTTSNVIPTTSTRSKEVNSGSNTTELVGSNLWIVLTTSSLIMLSLSRKPKKYVID